MNDYLFSGELSYAHKLTRNPQYNETSLHAHDTYEILYFISGSGELAMEGRKVLLFEGAVVLLPPRARHRIRLLSDLPYERAVINLPASYVDGALFEEVRVVDIRQNPRVRSLWKRMGDYATLFSREERESLLPGQVREMLLLLKQTAADGEIQLCHGQLITDALAYIERHITEIEGVEELCKALHVSRAWLYREFGQALGISPKRYINQRRLQIARHLLQVGEDATKVAFRCGYRDYSAFYRAYRAFFGVAPRET
ncbi:MAG: helix-turn-helix transcriptional regulator [Clostridia bacterium]|nr:helix-turn-helix transcriptional regulator [Clostridia bacterium]